MYNIDVMQIKYSVTLVYEVALDSFWMVLKKKFRLILLVVAIQRDIVHLGTFTVIAAPLPRFISTVEGFFLHTI